MIDQVIFFCLFIIGLMLTFAFAPLVSILLIWSIVAFLIIFLSEVVFW